MIGFIDLVVASGDTLDEEQRTEMLGTISAQADDVLNLIEDLLASARVEAGTLRVVVVSVDLAAQARQVIEVAQPGSRAEVRFMGGEGAASADPARVRQVLRNLVSNAIRYGGPHVDVQVLDGAEEAVVEVRDDGDGIPDADRSSVFEAYVQSDATRKVAESVGLGLSVSRDLARLMGGDLTYELRDDQSVFSLRLPRVAGEDGSGTDLGSEVSMVGAPRLT
jgi:signal transduction histidine kinase